MPMSERPSPFWPRGLSLTLQVPQLTLPANLEIASRRFPDKTAYVAYGHALTYRQLLHDSEHLAAWLQRRAGVRRGDRVLLVAQSSLQFVIAYQAILRADGVAVLVNPMNLGPEIAHIVADSGARVAIAAQELAPRLQPLLGGGPLAQLLLFAYRDAADEPGADAPAWYAAAPVPAPPGATRWPDALGTARGTELAPAPAEASPDDPCLIAYTSGTTAHPKGCVHTHRSLLTGAVTAAAWRADGADTVFLGASPMFHMQGLQALINTSIHLGATVVLLPRWDACQAAELIQRHRVNRWGVAPPMLLDLLALPALARDALASVGIITGGGAALPESVNQRLADELDIVYLEAYGMTETASMVMANPPQRRKRQCLGIPTFGVAAMVVDPVTLEAWPDGETPESGELWVSGAQVSPHGYWRDDAATAETFVVHDGRRWVRTGDLVRRDADGYYFLVDRLKRMINAGGFKVWPSEVETLLHAHPAIAEVCVVATQDARRGEQVTAVVVVRAGMALRAEELIGWSRDRMGAYKCPRAVEFVERLPRSGTGKIDWRGLQDALRVRPSPSP